MLVCSLQFYTDRYGDCHLHREAHRGARTMACPSAAIATDISYPLYAPETAFPGLLHLHVGETLSWEEGGCRGMDSRSLCLILCLIQLN